MLTFEPSTANVASLGFFTTCAPRRWSHASAPGPPIPRGVRPSTGSWSSGAIFAGVRRNCLGPSSSLTGAESAMRACRAARGARRTHVRLRHSHRKRTGPRSAVERGEIANEHGRRGRAVEGQAGPRGDDDDPCPAGERGVARRPVDGVRDRSSSYWSAPVEDARRRRDVRAEDVHAEGRAEARGGAKPEPCRCGVPDGCAPVGLDCEARPAGRRTACRRP